MSSLKNTIQSVVIIAALAAAMSFKVPGKPQKASANLTIRFQNYAGNELLKLDSVNYKNEFGQNYTISKFRYYISNISLTQSNGAVYKSNEYFLVDEEDEKSKRIVLQNIPQGNYASLSFIVGVDSLHNCSGAQSGALDPINGMFWAWNTGYIFLKIEGYSPASKSPGHIYEFHIGGYQPPNNCIRKITLDMRTHNVNMSNGHDAEISIKVDASDIFKSPNAIDFSKISSVTDFHNATTIADNYCNMFSILKVK